MKEKKKNLMTMLTCFMVVMLCTMYKPVKAAEITLNVQSGQDISSRITEVIREGNGNSVVIRIPAGQYTVKTPVTLKSNVHIIADENTIVDGSSSSGAILQAPNNHNLSNITIEGGVWSGSKETVNIFQFYTASNITIANCRFAKAGKSAIRFTKTKNAVMKNCIVENSKENGIHVTDHSTVSLVSAEISSNKETGLAVYDGSVVQVSNSNMAKNGNYGIYVTGSKLTLSRVNAQENNWSGVAASKINTTLNVSSGVFDNNGRNAKMTDEGSLSHGIAVYGQAEANISGIQANNNKGCGISPFSNVNVVLSNCNISNNGAHGIGGRNQVKLTIQNCIIQNNSVHGIMVNTSSSALSITGNQVIGNGKCGISVGAKSKASLKNNNMDGNMDVGIYSHTDSSVTVKGGSANNNQKYGLAVYKNSKLAASGVTVKSNKHYGVNVNQKSTLSLINSKIEENSGTGIRVNGSSIITSLQKNTINKNGEVGVYLNKSTANSIQNNKILNHAKYGLALYKGAKGKTIKKNQFSNQGLKYEIYVSKSNTKVGTVPVVKVTSAKIKNKVISGTGIKQKKISSKINGIKYSVASNKKGKFKIKLKKPLQKGIYKLEMKDNYGNAFYRSITVK